MKFFFFGHFNVCDRLADLKIIFGRFLNSGHCFWTQNDTFFL